MPAIVKDAAFLSQDTASADYWPGDVGPRGKDCENGDCADLRACFRRQSADAARREYRLAGDRDIGRSLAKA